MKQNRTILFMMIQDVDKYLEQLHGKVALLRKELDDAKDGDSGYLALLDTVKREMAEVNIAQKALKAHLADLNAKADLTDLVKIKEAVGRNVELLKGRLDMLDRSPDVIMEKVLKPTVEIAVRDRKGDHGRGSGVLFKREKLKNGKYRYTGFTAYHVWEDILLHIENVNDGIAPSNIDKTLNPKLLIRTYAGSHKVTRYITNATMLWPTKYQKDLDGARDFILFQFESAYNMPVAELASDEDMKKIQVGNRIWVTGTAHHGSVSLYNGIMSNGNLGVRSAHSAAFHAFAYFGNSGGPIYDARTLKVIGITQRVGIGSVLGKIPGGYAITDILVGHLIHSVRKTWKQLAPKQYKKLLD
jgi:hypothetical protein